VVFFWLGGNRRANDRELEGLREYLVLIATVEPDFGRLNHKYWKAYVEQMKR